MYRERERERKQSGKKLTYIRCTVPSSPSLPVALRYLLMRWLKGKREVVAPISAPMLQMVAMPTRRLMHISKFVRVSE